MSWVVNASDEFESWFFGLTDDEKVDIVHCIELLELLGPQLTRPHVDAVKGSKLKNLK